MGRSLRGGCAALAAGLLLLVVAVPSPAAAPGPAPAGVIQRRGAALVLEGTPLRLIGYNNYRLTSMPGRHECGGAVSERELAEILDGARASGANVVRSWFFQSYARPGTADRWAAFDRLLEAASSRGLRVIPVLVNHWEACDNSPIKTAEFYAGGYRRPNSYGNPQSYRSYAADVARHYAGHPAVAFWQLVNEAETAPACGVDGAAMLRAFADDMAGTVKAADPHHLVSLGTIGSGQCGAQGTEYREVHAGDVDLCEYHDYDAPQVAVPGDDDNGLQARINQCTALGKPFVIGESGIYRDIGPSGARTGEATARTLQARAGFFERKLTAQLAQGVDGFLVWSLGRASSDGYDVSPGDPTLAVLHRHGSSTPASASAGPPHPSASLPPSSAGPPPPPRAAVMPRTPPAPAPSDRAHGAGLHGWRAAWEAARFALSSTGALAVQGRHSLGLG